MTQVLVAYTANNHAVVGLPRSAALEPAPRGILVHAMCPAPIETNMAKALEVGGIDTVDGGAMA
jgi:NAD(P)-dependent dehydrogenase (short-subunit alcohol dehydrogenase family)